MLRHLRPGGALADAATLHRAAAATAGAPHAARHRGHSMRPHATAGDAAGSSGAVSLRHTAVIGGGMAGLAAAAELTAAGVRVTLVEQGRGLGGRVCRCASACEAMHRKALATSQRAGLALTPLSTSLAAAARRSAAPTCTLTTARST